MHPRVAVSGQVGLEILHENGFDLILCDIGMPGMNGYEFAQRVRSDTTIAGVYLVAVTGYGQTEDRARALNAGFNTHLVKPINLGDIEALLRNLNSREGGST